MHNQPHTDEAKMKISLAARGRIPWNKGIRYSSVACSENKKADIGLSNSILGQKRLMKNGYMRITISTYPNYQRVYEHRHVMESFLGRKLLSSESIHHINHDRTDNRLENLELIDKREHNRIHALAAVASGRHNGRFI